jgi:outer membrane protein assembly factor BamB
MFRFIAIVFALLLLAASPKKATTTEAFPSIESEFPLIWKTKMGMASFRTNVVITKDELIIGSNGSRFMDYNLFDKESGVYRLNRRSGAINKLIANEPLGDMDVNGVLLLDQKLYFGNDNEEFLCTSMDGKIIFRNPASGDIEHEPVLINNKGVTTIVYASERGEIRAISPTSGNTIWSYYTPDFNGWKPGDNRSIFKIGAFFSNTTSFFTKPLVYDINKDGVMDLVYVTFNNKLYAINGANGNLLWLLNNESRTNYMCTMVGSGDKRNLQLISSLYDSNGSYSSNLLSIDLHGKIVKSKKLNNNYCDNGLNAISLPNGTVIMNTRDTLLINDGKENMKSIDRTNTYMRKEYNSNNMVLDTRNSRDVLLGDKVFPYGDSKQTVIVLNQWDVTEEGNGFIEIVSLDQEKVVKRLKIKAYSEMPPVIYDVNKDGYLDVLISCSDGFLYCYNLKIKA